MSNAYRSTSSTPASPDAIRDRRPGVALDRVVIHTAEGTFHGTIAWFATPGRTLATAAHYVISQAGDVCQMVPDGKKAIHAGSTTEANWNDRSIGIEHEGHAADASFPEAMLRASACVVAHLCKTYGIPADREHIVGHVEVPHKPSDSFHHDPGPNWPWDAYMAFVAEYL